MFTGLVQAVGRVASLAPSPAGVRLAIDFAPWTHRPAVGDSISVSGCCLTAAAVGDGPGGGARVEFDAIPETLAKTTLGRLAAGSRVNLEHSVTASTLMGGHFVQGHVDGVGVVEHVQATADWRVRVRTPDGLRRYLTPKGSITVEGVSLTLAAVGPGGAWFEVALIPVTLERTTLGGLKLEDGVNLEADILAKTVVQYLEVYLQSAAAPPPRAG